LACKLDAWKDFGELGDFWFPARNPGSTFRFGGRAGRAIDYANYEIADAKCLNAGLHAFAEQPPK
jgi:hypothetical protein